MKIHIPTPLRSYTGGLETVSISGTTVNTVFDQLTTKYPDLKQHLFTPEGKLRSFVNVYLNDDDIRYLDSQQETAVKDTDELTIIPSIAGGTNSRSQVPDTRRETLPGQCLASKEYQPKANVQRQGRAYTSSAHRRRRNPGPTRGDV
jgi:molybdopterin converting factor small subunit